MESKEENIIVFCSHSDDQIFGPGATLTKYAQQGKNIYTVIFSYGETSLPFLKKEIAIKTRVNEAKKADKIINGKGVMFLGLKEGKFLKQAEEKDIKSRIQRMILSKKPIKIFTHSPEDPHPDHKAVYQIVTQALDELKYNCDLYCFDIWNPFTVKKHFPKLYEDVTETFSRKIKALKIFESQKITLFTLLWSVYVRAWLHGFHIHKKYAERFFKIR